MDSGDISDNTPEIEKTESPDTQEEAKASSPDQEAGPLKTAEEPLGAALTEDPKSDTQEAATSTEPASSSAQDGPLSVSESQEQTTELPSSSSAEPEASREQSTEPPSVSQERSASPDQTPSGGEEPNSANSSDSKVDLPSGDEPVQTVASLAAKPYPWVIHPIIDYLFVAGGLAFIVIACNYYLVGWKVPVDRQAAPEAPFVIAMYFCQHFFSNTHNVVTYIRLFNSEESKRKYRFYRTWLAYAFIAILLLCSFVLPGEFATGFSFLFTITIFIHFCMQAFGIAKIYCYKRGYMLGEGESEVFRWLMISMGVSFSSRFFLRKPWLRPAYTARLSHSGSF